MDIETQVGPVYLLEGVIYDRLANRTRLIGIPRGGQHPGADL